MRFTIFITCLSMVTILLVVAACTGSATKTEKAAVPVTQPDLASCRASIDQAYQIRIL